MNPPDAVGLWNDIKTWYAEHLPEALASLNPGASEEAIAAFEAELKHEIGQGLPRGLRDVYLQNDGQNRMTTTCGMFFGLEFSSLEYALFNWKVWKDIQDEPLNADLSENSTSYPPGAVRPVYANTGWVPFAHDGGGNHLGVDLAPGSTGREGQVVNFGRDEDNKFVIAPSFEGLLEWQLRQLQSGNFLIKLEKDDGHIERHVVLRTPSNSHLLDVVPKLFGPKRSFLDNLPFNSLFGRKPKT